jgi:hypothetical protein
MSDIDYDKARDIVENKYNLKCYGGIYIMPDEWKDKPEPEDFNEAANYLFNEWDFNFIYRAEYEKKFGYEKE